MKKCKICGKQFNSIWTYCDECTKRINNGTINNWIAKNSKEARNK